jgi:hypothetical protein
VLILSSHSFIALQVNAFYDISVLKSCFILHNIFHAIFLDPSTFLITLLSELPICYVRFEAFMANKLKSSEKTGLVSVELKTNISEIPSVSSIRVNVVNYCMSLIYIPVCQICASSY